MWGPASLAMMRSETGPRISFCPRLRQSRPNLPSITSAKTSAYRCNRWVMAAVVVHSSVASGRHFQ